MTSFRNTGRSEIDKMCHVLHSTIVCVLSDKTQQCNSVVNPYAKRQWIVQDVDQWVESQLHHRTQGSTQVCHQLVQEELVAEMEELQSWMMQK